MLFFTPMCFLFLLFRYPKFMKDHCSVTCGLCIGSSVSVTNPITVAPSCYDKDKRCPAWAAYANQCQSNRLFMSRMCKKTCGLCNKEKNDSHDHTSSLGSLASKPNLKSAFSQILCLATLLYTTLQF